MKIQIENIKSQVIEGDLERALELLIDGAANSDFEIESTLLISEV